MSYTTREQSQHEGQPVECFEFVTPFGSYLYTSGDVAVTVAAKTFTPLTIRRTTIKAGTHSEENLDVQIELPATCEFAKDCAYQQTPPSITAIVYRVHRGDDYSVDYVIYWKGPVAALALEGNIVKARVPSVFGNALAGHLPTIHYQGVCNHVLFDSGCKVVRSSYAVSTTVVSASGFNLQIASMGAFPDGYFIAGEARLIGTGERRMVMDQVGTVLTLNHPFGQIQPGDNIEVTAGCDHSYNGNCKNKFNNAINFGGFPFIPNINVFIEGF